MELSLVGDVHVVGNNVPDIYVMPSVAHSRSVSDDVVFKQLLFGSHPGVSNITSITCNSLMIGICHTPETK